MLKPPVTIMPPLITADPPADLAAYVDAGLISADDVAAVGVFVSLASRAEPLALEPLAWLALALALRTPRDGHTCVDLGCSAAISTRRSCLGEDLRCRAAAAAAGG